MKSSKQKVFIVDDDESVRDAMGFLLDTIDLPHRSFGSATEFLEHFDDSERGCLVADIRMPGMNGLQLQQELKDRNVTLPIIFVTGHGDIPMAVEAMKNGALDFLRKPFREQDLLDRIQQALEHESTARHRRRERTRIRALIDTLTPREKEVFERVVTGKANKVIAAELGISERTVEVHRSQVMQKLGVRTLADLVRKKLEADQPLTAH